MAYCQGCTCPECLDGHRDRWLSLSEAQSQLVATLANQPISASSLKRRGFAANTIASLSRNKALIRCLPVTDSESYFTLTVRGREVYGQSERV